MKERIIATWLPVVLMLIAAGLSYWLDRAVRAGAGGQAHHARHDPDYYIDDFRAVNLGSDGRPTYSLAAAKMVHYPDDDSTALTLPDFSGFTSNGAPVRITADRGWLSSHGTDVDFTGNVRVVRAPYDHQGATTLTTSFLHLVPRQKIATTNQAVTIVATNTRVTAVGMEMNNKTQILKLLSRVKARYAKIH
ncbi:MAG: LPS export ABC transporter periplasmic protein LptC [Betaproteobacteria bacterium]|nr:LPS export ABC transporter periplasmic protein LptC [Betaproteobacteria bacterium]